MELQLYERVARMQYGDHLSTLHEDEAGEMAVLAPFIRDGLAKGDRCLIGHQDFPEGGLFKRLEAAGVPVKAALERGALKLLEGRDAFLLENRFHAATMLAMLSKWEKEALAGGFKGLRWAGALNWIFDKGVDIDQVLEYESQVNALIKGRRIMIICQYHRPSFDPALIHDVLRTHPLAIIDNAGFVNAHYQPSELMLSPQPEVSDEYKRRRVEWWISQMKGMQASEDERRMVEQELRRIEQLDSMGRMAGSLAREFGHQLVQISAHSELLGPGRDGAGLGDIFDACDRAGQLVRQLMLFGRSHGLRDGVVDLSSRLRQLDPMLRQVLGPRLRLSLALAQSVLPIPFRSAHLEQLLLCLAVLARHALPEGGRLLLATSFGPEQPPHHTEFLAAFSGPQLDRALMESLPAPNTQGPALGLGAALAQVKASGGETSLESGPASSSLIFRWPG